MMEMTKVPPVDETTPLGPCGWPDCDHTGVLVQWPSGETWCLCHVVDDELPQLRPSKLAACVFCRSGTAFCCTVRGRTYPIHPNCLRRWFTGSTPVGQPVASRRLGAYARRSS